MSTDSGQPKWSIYVQMINNETGEIFLDEERGRELTEHPLSQAIGPLVMAGDWAAARGLMQKVAYGLEHATEKEARDAKDIMRGVATSDPLYARCLQDVLQVLATHPMGIKQTALYPHMPAAPDVETARYILFFAAEAGDLVREKKGNSYLVFAPKNNASVQAAAETDAERLERSPARAVDWVFSELQFASGEQLEAFRAAALLAVKMAHGKGVRTLEGAWPADASWPSGEEYLRTLGWLPISEMNDEETADEYDGPELMELLYSRLVHVSHRLYRDVQVKAAIDPQSATRWAGYTHVVINADSDWRGGDDPCGFESDTLVSIADGLEMLRVPAHPHPACRCTIDPYEAPQ